MSGTGQSHSVGQAWAIFQGRAELMAIVTASQKCVCFFYQCMTLGFSIFPIQIGQVLPSAILHTLTLLQNHRCCSWPNSQELSACPWGTPPCPPCQEQNHYPTQTLPDPATFSVSPLAPRASPSRVRQMRGGETQTHGRWTDRRTDGQTDRRHAAVPRVLGRTAFPLAWCSETTSGGRASQSWLGGN